MYYYYTLSLTFDRGTLARLVFDACTNFYVHGHERNINVNSIGNQNLPL